MSPGNRLHALAERVAQLLRHLQQRRIVFHQPLGAVEAGHHAGGEFAALAPRPILDVGCGEGLLARKIRHLPFETYVGIDFSPAPVAAARAALGDDLRLTFAVADAESYQPATEPDAIIFSECLNYLSDPVGIIEHYSKSIASNGFIIISLFQSPRADKAWEVLRPVAEIMDCVNIAHHSGKRWTIKLLTPRAHC